MKLIQTNELTNFNYKARKIELQPCMKELLAIANILDVGQGVLVEKSEWTSKTSPHINGRLRGKKFRVNTLVDGGWMVKRTA